MTTGERRTADHDDIAQNLRATLTQLRLWGLREVILFGSPRPDVLPSLDGEASASGGKTPPMPEETPKRHDAFVEASPPSDEPISRDERNRKASLLEDIRRDLGDCRRCPLHRGRTHVVFGEGDPAAPLVFVGEGPGADEDRLGRPFVGQAGQLLNKMIRAIGLHREKVYICNVVKCRPPGNRMPEPEEIRICSPFLIRQLEAIRPRVICTLGACASRTLLSTTAAISDLRRKIHVWRGIPLVATYHPAYLLRNSAKKADTWKDLLEVMALLHS